MLRLKVQSIRSLLWLGNIVVLLGIGLVIVRMWSGTRPGSTLFQAMPSDRISAAMKVDSSIEQRAKGDSRDWNQYKSTWTLNVTGKAPPKPVEVTEAEPEKPTLRPLDEVLKVEMLLAAGPSMSCVAVKYLEGGESAAAGGGGSGDAGRAAGGGRRFNDPRGRAGVAVASASGDAPPDQSQRVHRVGEELLPPWNGEPFFGKVLEVTAEGARFAWGGEEVVRAPPVSEVPLKGSPQLLNVDGSVSGGSGMDAGVEPEELTGDESRRLSDHDWFLCAAERDKISAEHEAISAEVKVTAEFIREEGTTVLKLAKVPAESLVAQRGFLEGDVIRRINDQPVRAKRDLVRYVQQNPGRSTYSITVERRGVFITKNFRIAR